MKIKTNFITNSSSVSYIIINVEELSVDDFINELWNSGLSELIKRNLISSLKNDFPFKSGVNSLYASSEDYSIFDLIFYNHVHDDANFENDKFIMKTGHPTNFIEDVRYGDDDWLKQSFPKKYHSEIDKYIEENPKKV